MLRASGSSVTFTRGVRRGVQQISRDRNWGATLLLLTGVMTLAQLFLVLLLAVNSTGALLTARAGIQLEILPTAPEQDIQALYATLRENPVVEDVVYVSSAEAYEQQKARDPELISFLEEYQLDNPFPDTFAVTLSSLNAYDSFAEEVQQDRWRAVVNPSFLTEAAGRQNDMQSLLQVTQGMRTLSIVFMVLAAVVLFLAVLEWVSRNAVRRGQELLLEHLLGASPTTVLLPFASEMTIFLATATVLGSLIVAAFLVLLPIFMPAFALEAPFQLLQSHMRPVLLGIFPLIVLAEIIVMPLLALAGTMLGIRSRMPASFTLFS